MKKGWKYLCSFCNKGDNEVKRMFITKGSRICNECVAEATKIMEEAERQAAYSAAAFEIIGLEQAPSAEA